MTTTNDIPFAPDDKALVHAEGAIRLMCRPFASHEDGIPEWLKNASDMYTRRDVAADDCAIIVMFRDGNSKRPSAIGCLDFGGMSTADIEDKFRNFADPEAARSESDVSVEGGHGNGGKCYMTQMFESHSYLHTLRNGRSSKYGFKGKGVVPGYFPSTEAGRGYSVANPDDELNAALFDFGITMDDLSKEARSSWEKSRGFTLVAGFAAKHHPHKKLPVKQLIENIQGHQQAIRTLQRNKVFTYRNGDPVEGASPIALAEIKPIAGAEAPRIIDVPTTLTDLNTGSQIETSAVAGESRLVLKTSDVSMRWTLKSRHTVNGWTHDGRSTGYWDVRDLSRAGYADKIYGDLYLNALDEYKQNDRRNHSNAPLTRAIKEWLTQQIDDYSAEFVTLDRLQASQEEKDELARINEALDAWKNEFLEREFGGLGAGGRGGRGGPPPPPPLPRGTPARLELRLTHDKAGRGISLKPRLDFFDQDGNRIRAVPYEWQSSDWAVATVDGELNMITTHTPGTTEIKAVCKDSGLESNVAMLEVLNISSIVLQPSEMEIAAGSRSPVTATVHTTNNRTEEGVYLIWAEGSEEVVSVGSSGMVFGLQPGETTVTAFDDKVMASNSVNVKIVEAKPGDKGGSGYPLILLSEIQPDPDTGVPPAFSTSEPPVHQRPQDFDRNVWWINMASPLARRYIDTARGGGVRTQEWRAYQLERYIEIMIKILLTYDFEHGGELTFDTMLRRWDEESTIMQVRIMESLQDFLDEGKLPKAA